MNPAHLIVIGQVAHDFGLSTKITGGQRIDMFGARVEQLPLIWKRLVDVGLESGYAYGKCLRTVKSCVGQSRCRFGVQDSTTLAIKLENRYRGLRGPHKVKMSVSGCARECAEARRPGARTSGSSRPRTAGTSASAGTELDAAVEHHVRTASDEWADTLADPERLACFTSFVNAPDIPDPSITFVHERGQIRPARPDEKPLVAGPVLQIVRA